MPTNYIFVRLLVNKMFESSLMYGTDMKNVEFYSKNKF